MPALDDAEARGEIEGSHDSRHNDIQHNDIQHNDTDHNDIQHNETQHNDAQNQVTVIMLSVTFYLLLC